MGGQEFDPTVTQSFAKASGGKTKVSYFYDPDIGSYYYGTGHPMKPQRMRMTHSLIMGYDLYKYMDVYRPHDASHAEMADFHDLDYLNFLAEVTPEHNKLFTDQMKRFNLGEMTDCPVFKGLFEFQASCAGASIDAAVQLNANNTDIAINWSGGLHHAKRAEASGFCYINDIVLGILELLKYHTRVMYIDIDIHHGDGVEEAFYLSNRVMTVSFHKFGDFFPGTGDLVDVGAGPGRYYAVNVPLDDGIDDEQYVGLFKAVISKCIEHFRPEAIVLQCGADSITGDRLGNFNVSSRGHGACVEFVRSYRLPLLVLGGGGYTIKNVARAWLYETSICCSKPVSEDIPRGIEYIEYYSPSYKLFIEKNNLLVNKNKNLDNLKIKIFEHLKNLEFAPSVPFNKIPPNHFFLQDPSGPSSNDLDDIEQYHVDFEGGGLAYNFDGTSRGYLNFNIPGVLDEDIMAQPAAVVTSTPVLISSPADPRQSEAMADGEPERRDAERRDDERRDGERHEDDERRDDERGDDDRHEDVRHEDERHEDDGRPDRSSPILVSRSVESLSIGQNIMDRPYLDEQVQFSDRLEDLRRPIRPWEVSGFEVFDVVPKSLKALKGPVVGPITFIGRRKKPLVDDKPYKQINPHLLRRRDNPDDPEEEDDPDQKRARPKISIMASDKPSV